MILPNPNAHHKADDESEDEIEVTGTIPGHVPLAGQKRPMRDLPWTGEWDALSLVVGRDLVCVCVRARARA